MAFLRLVSRGVFALIGGLLLAVGGVELALDWQPEHRAARACHEALIGGVNHLVEQPALAAAGVPRALPQILQDSLEGPARYVFAGVGVVLLVGALLPGKRREEEATPAGFSSFDGSGVPADKRGRKKVAKTAATLAKKGAVLDAAELAFSSGLLDEAAQYFLDADEPERAAEIRHDQNRFIESAELYLKAGRYDAAGNIFSQQGEFGRAADAFLEAGSDSVAAEMFVEAGNFAQAAECFARSGFPRHAAQVYVKCESWEKAARCLEEAIVDDHSGSLLDASKQAEARKLHKMAGNLYRRAGLDDRAQAILIKGGCNREAAEVALSRGEERKAADLLLEAGDTVRGAELLVRLGDTRGAARVLAEYHRDRDEIEDAARLYEEAGDDQAAADLYHLLEQYDRSAECYERHGDDQQAAEMFRLAGDRMRAAKAYERARCYADAAESYALAGDGEHEAEMLEMAGEPLKAGELHHRNGRMDEAIRALQTVESAHPESPRASALLSEIFRERGMHSLAVKTLNHAIGDQEVTRDNIRAFYELATAHDSNDELRDARDLYEKILAFDYHYGDTEQRLAGVRERLDAVEALKISGCESNSPLLASGRGGRYQITGKLGRGGMGIVYKANDTVLDRTVAFKVLPETLKENPQALKNFLREAKSAAQLNHPNIVTVYDAGEQDGLFYIAMEYVDGNTLKEIVKHRGKISAAGIIHVLTGMCEALAFAHDKKIVHRDIKTANTMWTRDRATKIMDFGLAKVIEEVRNHTTVVSGTPYYMSPEQTLGRNVDHRTDIYSLGVTLFELATATLPFREGNLPYHHVHTPPPDPHDFNRELPELIAEIIRKCLQKDPADRYQSARDILTRVGEALGG